MASTFKETFTVNGEQLLKKTKELIEEGNVRKITIILSTRSVKFVIIYIVYKRSLILDIQYYYDKSNVHYYY